MTSLQTMANPYGQRWRVSGSDSASNVNKCTGTGCSNRYRLPLFRCSSAGEMVNQVQTNKPRPTPDCELTFIQKSNVSVIKDWVVEKFVNTCSSTTAKNLTMPDRHMDIAAASGQDLKMPDRDVDIEAVHLDRQGRYNTMQKPRQFLFGANINRWQAKAPSLTCQPPRFADFRIFPCHQFEFFNNMNNTMDIPQIRPYGPQTFMGIQSRPHKQNLNCKSKHLHNPTRKVTKKDGFANNPVAQHWPLAKEMPSESDTSDSTVLSSENKSTRSHVHKTSSPTSSLGNDIPTCSLRNDFQLKEDGRNIQPSICSGVFKVKEQTEKLPESAKNVAVADDDSQVTKDDSDKDVDPLVNDASKISLDDVDNVKLGACSTYVDEFLDESRTKVPLVTSDTAQNNDVLLLRKTCKKGRPSARKQRKRRRQKAKLTDCSAKAADICDINNKQPQTCCRGDNLKPSKCQREPCKKQFGCSAIEFILGLHSISDDITDSFSEDEDDDDDDDDVDFVNVDDFSAIFPQCNLLSVLPQHEKQKLFVYLGGSSIPPSVNDDRANLDAINASWNIQVSSHSGTDEASTTKHSKKVRFDDDHLVTIHPMIVWKHAYQSSRKGPWEDYARDRLRFKRRITEAEKTLSHVFNPLHRATVYQLYYS